MLADHDVMATVADRSLKAARTFYENTLGLKPTPKQQEGTLSFQCGKSILVVYE